MTSFRSLRRTTTLWLCLCIVGGTLLSGCAFTRGELGDRFQDDKINGLKKGVTSRAEVVTALGAPDRITEINNRDVYQYYHYDLKASGLFLILLNFSRLQLRSDDLYVFLTKDGLVDEVVYGKRTDRMEFRFWPFGD